MMRVCLGCSHWPSAIQSFRIVQYIVWCRCKDSCKISYKASDWITEQRDAGFFEPFVDAVKAPIVSFKVLYGAYRPCSSIRHLARNYSYRHWLKCFTRELVTDACRCLSGRDRDIIIHLILYMETPRLAKTRGYDICIYWLLLSHIGTKSCTVCYSHLTCEYDPMRLQMFCQLKTYQIWIVISTFAAVALRTASNVHFFFKRLEQVLFRSINVASILLNHSTLWIWLYS